MSFTLDRSEEQLVVAIEGHLVVTNRQELKQAVGEAVEQGVRLVLLDCTHAAYIDSSGLGALVSLKRQLREVGGDLRLVALHEDLRSLFEMTRLDQLFPSYATLADARTAPAAP
jgi:anti-sigma B factor antagonist